MKRVRIAIDGPSGSGKSTIAKRIARILGIDYVDTGAMYRAIGYKVYIFMKEDDIKSDDAEEYISTNITKILENTKMDFCKGDIMLDGKKLGDEIRVDEISIMASKVAKNKYLREKLVDIQREIAKTKSVVMDGRDIGTNVIKDAEVKIFLTASEEVRARRRFCELKEKGIDVAFDDVLEDIKKRDFSDKTRDLNPLVKSDNAIEIDTSGKTIEEITNQILEVIKRV